MWGGEHELRYGIGVLGKAGGEAARAGVAGRALCLYGCSPGALQGHECNDANRLDHAHTGLPYIIPALGASCLVLALLYRACLTCPVSCPCRLYILNAAYKCEKEACGEESLAGVQLLRRVAATFDVQP